MTTAAHNQASVQQAIARAEFICNEKKLRFTQLRRAVLQVICASARPVSAYDIVARVSSNNDNKGGVAAMSVYRTLDFLQHNGLVHKISTLGAYTACTHPLAHRDCYFLICVHCHSVRECCDKAIDRAIDHIHRKCHFHVEQVGLEIHGQCDECVTNRGRTHEP